MSGLSWRTTVTVVLLIATMIAIASAAVVISRPSDPLRAADAKIGSVAAEGSPASVTIVAGDSAAVIARRLLASQVIESDTRFELLALLFGWESRLEPGSYTFEAGLTTYEILRRIHFGEISPLRLVIPEGLRLEQVTERLAQAGVIDRAELAAALATAAESTVAG
ncbi:MAG: endolytic transglycosylase MltG, partial [Chloroflexi bacterium]|nr:endolytic transglycosylase MltG [Chloroflexota bacterium]